MVARIKDLRTYTECIRAANELHTISKQLEQFADWYCQDFFEDSVYENYIDEACRRLGKLVEMFHELAEEQLQKSAESK